MTTRRFIVTLAGLALVVTPSLLALRHQKATAATPPPVRQPVRSVHPVRRDLPLTVTLPGALHPYAHARIYAKVPGYLKTIHVDTGDHVRAGQLLAVIDAPELQAQVSAARSRILQARARLAERAAAYRKATTERDIRTLSYQRIRKARQQSPDLIAQMDEDDASAKAALATAEVARAQSDLEAAKAQIAAEQAAERQVAEQLAYTRITAPFAGVITARLVDPGTLIQTAVNSASQAQPLVELSDTGRLRLDIQVAESDVTSVHAGTPLTVRVPAVPRLERQVTVTRTAQAEDPRTRTMLAEVDLDNRDGAWHPGMYAEVILRLQQRQGALVLPSEAIVHEADHTFVRLLGPGDRISRREVRIGHDDGQQVEILQGVSLSDTVALTDGDAAEVAHG